MPTKIETRVLRAGIQLKKGILMDELFDHAGAETVLDLTDEYEEFIESVALYEKQVMLRKKRKMSR